MSESEGTTGKAITVAEPVDLQSEILGAFTGDIEPVEVPTTYRLGILLVAIVMVILPLVYLAIIALVCYLVYYHAVNHAAMLSAVRGRGVLLVFLAYLAPMIAGAILIAFMFKPLFSRPAKQPRRRSLTRGGEPLVFAFVDRICAAVGAAAPERIDIDCQVNASASFRRGWLSFLGNDLVLTIGMPLVAGMNLRQFAGVLAHEFGHFSQGAGMRLTYIIRSISHWFTRVVYERDTWDEKLVEFSAELDLRIGWILYIARLFVWLTRKLLWVLMMAGHAVSGFMLRQMEFDADRHEARLAGSDTFEATARQLMMLNVAMQGAQADLGDFYREGRLADDLPRLVIANIDDFEPEVRAKINKLVDDSETGLLDTHPSDRERIASARRENAPGVFRLTQPASILFQHFDAASKNVTWDFYTAIFGPQFKRDDVHPIDDMLQRRRAERETYDTLRRYLQNGYSTIRPLRLPSWHIAPPADPKQTLAELKSAREEMLALWPKYRTCYQAYDEADTHLVQAGQAMSLLSARQLVLQDTFAVPMTTVTQASAVRDAARRRQAQLDVDLSAAERAAGLRLYRALELLFTPPLASAIPEANRWRAECRVILPACSQISVLLPPLLELRNCQANLAALFGQLRGNEENHPLMNKIQSSMQNTSELIRRVYTGLTSVTYPFDHAEGEVSIAKFALDTLPHPDNPGELYDAAEQLGSGLTRLNARMIGRLAVFAEAVERQFGMEPLPEPPDEDANDS